ncbi:SIFamide-related peptide [Chelonus insularis]|uniref:SIFamide-related peptide n=1 Tax=Chelonus insularis TaxID=460826 RepID=UPI001588D78F|nr:SIFamide-related peptide [Chelonus insularis]
MISIRIILVVAVFTLVYAITVEAAYKKPPFNGSIFGKRSYAVADYEAFGRAFSAMCETASEACNAWLLHQESN